MKIPETINIGGIDIKIEYSESEDERLRGAFGCYNHIYSTIVIASNASKSQQWATFIHETIEAINAIYNIELKHHQVSLLEVALNQSGLIK